MRVAAVFAVLAIVPFAVAGPKPKRTVIVSWDGAADWVVDRLLHEGKLPNVARMAKNGIAAEYSTPPFPSKTAVSHVSIFSGAWPEVTGVSGNSVPLLPKSEHTILETRSGFDANSHFVDPLWVAAAKAGKKVLSLSAAGSFPPGPDQERLKKAGVPLNRWVEFSGFESKFADARMVSPKSGVSASITLGDQTLVATAIDSPKDATQGFDTVSIQLPSGNTVELKPREATEDIRSWSPPVRVTKGDLFGNVHFRLFSLNAGTGNFEMYQSSVSGILGTETRAETEKYLDAYGAFHDDAFWFYGSGGLGKPIYRGGDGTAERRVLEIVRLDCSFLKRSFRYGLKRWNPDLVFHYTPMSDSAGHTWMGLLDPNNPSYDARVAGRIWPFYEKVFQLQDDWLGDMMDAAGKDALFALVADHGMAGIDAYFGVNKVLLDAGLLALKPDGSLDLSRTQVCAPPWGDFLLVVNTTDWKGGIVPPSEVESVLDAAERALLNARVPETGQPIVRRVWRRKDAVEMGIDGPTTGDLYLDFAYGFYPSNRANAPLISKAPSDIYAGVHGFWPARREMQAIFYLSGPGVVQGKQTPGVRVIDIAPTICQLMGIPPIGTGRVLAEAIRR